MARAGAGDEHADAVQSALVGDDLHLGALADEALEGQVRGGAQAHQTGLNALEHRFADVDALENQIGTGLVVGAKPQAQCTMATSQRFCGQQLAQLGEGRLVHAFPPWKLVMDSRPSLPTLPQCSPVKIARLPAQPWPVSRVPQ